MFCLFGLCRLYLLLYCVVVFALGCLPWLLLPLWLLLWVWYLLIGSVGGLFMCILLLVSSFVWLVWRLLFTINSVGCYYFNVVWFGIGSC